MAQKRAPQTAARSDNQAINVFGMGVKGVNLVKSPLELDPDEVTTAQNAEPFRDQGVAGIRKRAGLQRVVPTGTVAPSAAGGTVLGGFVIDDSLGYPGLNPSERILFANGYYSTDGGTTWTAYTPTQTFPSANSVYNLATGYDTNLTPLMPPVWLDGVFYLGGASSGQVLCAYLTKAALGATPGRQMIVREATRVTGSGASNDTYVLPGLFVGIGSSPQLVISIAGGACYLYEPTGGTVTKLPTLGATVTGSADIGGRLWVVAGLSLYSIDPFSETAWTTAATVADAGIAALTGLAVYNGNLYAGSRTNATQPVRVYKFVPNALGTATASTSASVAQSGNPSYMFGPYPPLSGRRLVVLYSGNAGLFDTLQGSAGNAESMTGVSWRVLTFDGTLWHNGDDTNSDNLINDAWGSSSNIQPGPMQNTAGRLLTQYTRFQTTQERLATIQTNTVPGSDDWAGGYRSTAGVSLPDSFFALPYMMF